MRLGVFSTSCYLFYHYIKPQHLTNSFKASFCCYLFYHYIKPQRDPWVIVYEFVVIYSITTSNHNCSCVEEFAPRVVIYSITTSNHNDWNADN